MTLEQPLPLLSQLWRNQQLCDLVLCSSDGWEFPCHRVVLAAASRFFLALTATTGTQMRESRRPTQTNTLPTIELQSISGEALRLTLEAIYCGNLPVNVENVEELLQASSFLELEFIRKACCELLVASLTVQSALHTLAVADAYSCQDLYERALAQARDHFDTVCSTSNWTEVAQELSLETLTRLLTDSRLQVTAEIDVLKFIACWLEGNTQATKQQLLRLLPAIRMPHQQMLQQAQQAFQNCSHVAREMLTDALHSLSADSEPEPLGFDYRKLRRLAHGTDGSQSVVTPRSASSGTCLVMAGGHDASWFCPRSVELYDPARDAWTAGPAMPPLPGGGTLSFAGAARARAGLCVVGGAAHSAASSVHVLPSIGDPHPVRREDSLARRAQAAAGAGIADRGSEGSVWLRYPRPRIPRVHAAVAALSGDVYLLGGRTSGYADATRLGVYEVPSVERLDMSNASSPAQAQSPHAESQPSWVGATPMLAPRTSLAAAGLDGARLYAIGGQAGSSTFASVEEYDILSGQWTSVAPMQSARKYCAAAVLDRRLYVVGGVDHARMQLSSVEAFDPREGRWTSLASMSSPRSSCGLAALSSSLFVAGGHGINGSVHDSMEMYEPAADRWLPRAAMGHARCGMALGVL